MDDLFDQVKKELENDGGLESAPEVEKAAPEKVAPEQSAQDLIDDIS